MHTVYTGIPCTQDIFYKVYILKNATYAYIGINGMINNASEKQ